MLWKILISLALIAVIFATAILIASQPYGGPKNAINFLKAIFIVARGNIHNFFSVIRLIKRKGIKSVHHRYPKTTDFVICSFILATIMLSALIFAGLL